MDSPIEASIFLTPSSNCFEVRNLPFVLTPWFRLSYNIRNNNFKFSNIHLFTSVREVQPLQCATTTQVAQRYRLGAPFREAWTER